MKSVSYGHALVVEIINVGTADPKIPMTIPAHFGLYAILTDPIKGYEYMTKLFVDHKIAFIQLRMKNAPDDVITATAEKLMTIVEGSSSQLIINDSPQIAKQVGAHGVHIGQDDLEYTKARAIAGAAAVIGISTHSVAQAKKACLLGPDYIGVGPVFPTPTKAIADPAIGLLGLKNMLAEATVPAVAIGGIDLTNLPDVLSAGARNFCMVRQLMKSETPQKTLLEVLRVYHDHLQE